MSTEDIFEVEKHSIVQWKTKPAEVDHVIELPVMPDFSNDATISHYLGQINKPVN